MKQAIVFDIDGTLADASHRHHFLIGKPKNWPAFFDAMKDDEPIPPTVGLCAYLLMLHASAEHMGLRPPFEVVFCTGRPDSHRAATEAWLRQHLQFATMFPTDFPRWLYMREAGDHRPDYVVKRELIAKMRADGIEPTLVFEDRKQCVDMWRQNGITCCQVAEGDF